MGNLFLPTLAEARAPNLTSQTARGPTEEALVVASFNDPVAVDYAEYTTQHQVAGCRLRIADLTKGWATRELKSAVGSAGIAALVVFLKPRLSAAERLVLDQCLRFVSQRQPRFVAVVSTFRIHLDDRCPAEAEAYVLRLATDLGVRPVVFRPAPVLSRGSLASNWLRRLGSWYPLVPRRLRGCGVDGDEFFAAIEAERQAHRPHEGRVYTLLGPNRPWRELLARYRPKGPWQACLTVVSAVLALLLVGQLGALVLALVTRARPSLRRWNLDTLRPRSFRELLTLCNKYNFPHVKVVGYNNGVIHFGHRYPGKTVVSTVHCDRVTRAGHGLVNADCGATVRKALNFLAGAGQELYVIPNYSYVCLGTSFFVPIHGSAVDYSTLADTITRVTLYDPARDCLLVTARHESTFRDHIYNLASDVVLLRLHLRVKPKARYYVRVEELRDPDPKDLLSALRDSAATNVEIRKARAGSSHVRVFKYYQDSGAAQGPVLELPRDSLGRLWDRLEENRITSFVMHALTRYFAWHVELFLPAEDFATFWRSHRALPLRKIQLRYIRRDGLPHSPFRAHDCVSADLFMLRRHRRRFEAYLRETFASIQTNPGKHSR
jgi:hypothetical protein